MLHERVTWAANLILALVAYGGIIFGFKALAKIDRHVLAVEEIAQSVHDSSQALLKQVRGMLSADRPWLLAAVERSTESENRYNIIISNQGRTPAEIVSLKDRIAIVSGEEYLPNTPEYSEESLKKSASLLILVPGEFVVVQTLAESDLQWICKTAECRRRVENSEDQIFLHGRVTYRNLAGQDEDRYFSTDWCCKCLHNEGHFRLAITGPCEYIKHS